MQRMRPAVQRMRPAQPIATPRLPPGAPPHCPSPVQISDPSTLVLGGHKDGHWEMVVSSIDATGRLGPAEAVFKTTTTEARSAGCEATLCRCRCRPPNGASGGVGSSTPGGRGVDRAPQDWGVREKGSVDRTINQLLSTLAPTAPKMFFSIENGQNVFTKSMANDDFSEPPRRADSKKFHFVLPNSGSMSPPGPGGSVSVGFAGGGGGGASN